MVNVRFFAIIAILWCLPETLAARVALWPETETRPTELSGAINDPTVEHLLPEAMKSCLDRANSLEQNEFKLTSIVATIPDPLDSNFAREFDYMVGSISRSMVDLGYDSDRFWLPWLADPEARKEAKKEKKENLHRRLPGLLLFRKDGEAGKKAVLVLLVGETPVWGVHEAAMEKALFFTCFGFDLDQPKPLARPLLKFLAPAFSGGSASVCNAMNTTFSKWKALGLIETVPPMVFISGTANQPDYEPNLGALAHSLEGPKLTGLSMATSSKVLFDSLLKFLPGHMGIVIEADSGSNTNGDTDGKADPDRGSTLAVLQESSAFGESFQGRRDFLLLPFPMNIAALRGEYEREFANFYQALERETTAAPASQFKNLPLNIGGETPNREHFPLFNPKHTSRAQELVWAGIFKKIAMERVRAVVILASNTMDKLFLAEMMRRHAPDVRLITVEGDILLAHPNTYQATRGMLVVSSHAMIDPNPLELKSASNGAGDSQIYLPFSTDGAQGVFRATRKLLKLGDGGTTGRTIADELSALEAEVAAENEVWVGVVGRGAIYPLARFQPERSAETGSGSYHQSEFPLPPRGWYVLFLIATLMVLVAIFLMGRYWKAFGPDLFEATPVAEPKGDEGHQIYRNTHRTRRGLQVAIPLTVIMPYYLIGGPYLQNFRTIWPLIIGWLTLAALVFIFVCLSLGLLAENLADFRAMRKRKIRTPWILPIFLPWALGLILFVLMVMAVIYVQALFREPAAALLYARCIAFGSGVSPLLPLMFLLALPLGWCILSIARHHSLDNIPELEDLSGTSESEKTGIEQWIPVLQRWLGTFNPDGGIEPQIRNLRGALNPGSFSLRSYGPIWILTFAIPLAYFMFQYRVELTPILRGLEHPGYDRVVSLFFGLGMALAVGSVVSAWRGWRAFEGILHWLRDLKLDAQQEQPALHWLARVQQISPKIWSQRSLIREHRNKAFAPFRSTSPAPTGAKAENGMEPMSVGEKHSHKIPKTAPELTDALLGKPTGPSNDPRSCAKTWLRLVNQWKPGPESAPTAESKEQAATAEGSANASHTKSAMADRDFFSWQTTLLTKEVLGQLMYLMSSSTLTWVLLMLCLLVYPFEPQRLLLLYLSSMMFLTMVVSAVILIQIDNDPDISILTGSKPSATNWPQLLKRLSLLGGVPLLSLLAGQFPEIRSVLTDWIGSILKLLM